MKTVNVRTSAALAVVSRFGAVSLAVLVNAAALPGCTGRLPPAEGEGEGEGDPCTADGPLVTATVGAGFLLAASAEGPDDLVAFDMRADGSLVGLFADATIAELGTWPAVAVDVRRTILSGDDTVDTAFASPFVVATADGAVVGYTRLDGSGVLRVFNGSEASEVNAPGNFTAAADGDNLIVNGFGMGAVEGAAVYSAPLSALDAPTRRLLLPADTYSGYTAVSADGSVVVAGYFDGSDNVLRALPEASFFAAADADLDLVSDELYRGVMSGVVGLGGGFAVLTAGYDATFAPVIGGISFIPTLLSGDAVATNPALPVLEIPDSCVSVVSMAAARDGASLFALLSGAAGTHIVQITPAD